MCKRLKLFIITLYANKKFLSLQVKKMKVMFLSSCNEIKWLKSLLSSRMLKTVKSSLPGNCVTHPGDPVHADEGEHQDSEQDDGADEPDVVGAVVEDGVAESA